METLSNAPPSAVTQLLRRFKDNVPITPDELPVVREVGWEIREIRRRQSILTEGSKNRAVYFVVDGFLIRYRILRDGQRQIVDLALPGDFAARIADFDRSYLKPLPITEFGVANWSALAENRV